MRISCLAVGFALMVALGCAGGFGASPKESIRLRSIDGLDREEISLPGLLEIRENHGIGAYDAFLIPESTIAYKRDSLRLSREGEQIFLELLRDTIVELSEAATIPVLDDPGPCVMQINLDVARMDLDTARDANQLAEMTLVMQFRDSQSREVLLRYATINRVPNPELGMTHDSQIRRGLKQIVDDMDLSTSLRGAGLADDAIKPGCKGTLAAIGRAAVERRRNSPADRSR